MNDFEKIFHQWHEYASTRNVDALINLYDEQATLESPLVPIILHQKSGLLVGKESIYDFLVEGAKRRPNELVRW